MKKSYYQSKGEVVLQGVTFGDYLEQCAQEVPDKNLLVYEDSSYTYREFNQLVDHIALGMIHHGFVHGDRLSICLPDWIEYTVFYYAAGKLGIPTSPVSPRYREKEFLQILGHSGAKGIVIPSEWRGFNYIDLIRKIKPQLPQLEKVFVVGEGEFSQDDMFISYKELQNTLWETQYTDDYLHKVYLREHPVDADDILEIAYTSGTTGTPKGVLHTHNTRLAAAILNNQRWGSREEDVMVLMAPLAHATGSAHAQNGAIIGRFTLVYLEAWEAERCLKAIEKNRATVLIGVPAMYVGMMNHPHFKQYDVSSVRAAWNGGAAAPVAVAKRITEEFGCSFVSVYGTTECGGNFCTFPEDDIETACSTVGLPLDTMEVKLVNEAGQTVPVGDIGEILSRGPMRMLGYYKNPDATFKAIDRSGWFYSGDLGQMDENGYLRIVGRLKDMIVRGGENVYASEIEEVLATHPDVAESYVVGYPDPYLGERTCAFIIPKNSETVFTRESLLPFFEGKIAKYKIPDRVETVSEVPRTPSGKTQKFKLQEMLQEKIEVENNN